MSLSVELSHAQQLPVETIQGALPICVRFDAAATTQSVDGLPACLQVDASGSLRTTGGSGSETITSLTPGNGAAQLGKADDAAHSTGDCGVQVLAVWADRAGGALGASLVTTDGDYSPLSVSSEGHLRVEEGCRAVRSSIAIAGSSWAKGDSEAAMSMDGHRGVAFSIIFSSATANASHFLTVEVSADGSTYCPLQDIGFTPAADASSGTVYVCKGTLSGLPHKWMRLTNRSVVQTTLSPLLVTRHN